MSNVWDQAFETAQREAGPLPLEREAFERRARARLTRRLARQGRGAGELSLGALLDRTALGDLYLSLALEDGSPEARDLLAARAQAPLTAVARALGRSEAEAGEEVPAALREAAAPVLPAFDGSAGLVAWLAVRMARGRASSACPAENLLAGLAEGRLDAREGEPVARHVRACETCRAALDVLQRAGLAKADAVGFAETLVSAAGPGALPPPLPRPHALAPSSGRRPLITAVLAIGGIIAVSLLAAGRGLWDSEARRQDTELSVKREAQALARSDASYFGDFEPYDRAALALTEAEPAPTGFAAIFPRGKVLERTPAFLWSHGTTAGPFVVTLRDESGDVVWTRTVAGDSLPWPADAPPLLRELEFTWTVAPEGQPEGPEGGIQASFRVEAEQELKRWQRRTERLARAVPDQGTRDVFTAQMALRRGYVWEAFTITRAHLERAPKDSYGRALLEHIQRLHGLRP